MSMDAYDPITVLMDEHQRFLRHLDHFATEMQRLSALPRLRPPEVHRISEFGQFLARDVDGAHARKEEEVIFPVLARYLPSDSGPIGTMLAEHDLLREHCRTIEQGAQRLERDDAAIETLRAVGGAERESRVLLSSHIDKEDHVLFPMARDLLSAPELSEIAILCQRIDSTPAHPDDR